VKQYSINLPDENRIDGASEAWKTLKEPMLVNPNFK
jgi:hypothetical protein